MQTKQLSAVFSGLRDACSWHRWACVHQWLFYKTLASYVLLHFAMAGWDALRVTSEEWVIATIRAEWWLVRSLQSQLVQLIMRFATHIGHLFIWANIHETLLLLQKFYPNDTSGSSSNAQDNETGVFLAPGQIWNELIQFGIHAIGNALLSIVALQILGSTINVWFCLTGPCVSFVMATASMEGALRHRYPNWKWKERVTYLDSRIWYLLGFGIPQVCLGLWLNRVVDLNMASWVFPAFQPLWVILLLRGSEVHQIVLESPDAQASPIVYGPIYCLHYVMTSMLALLVVIYRTSSETLSRCRSCLFRFQRVPTRT